MKVSFFFLLLLFFNQDEDFKFAMGLFNDGVYTLAHKGFIDFAQTHPESELLPDAKYFAAECLYRGKQYRDAIQEFELVHTLYPKFALRANIRIGQTYYELGVIDSGIVIFEEIRARLPVEIDPKSQAIRNEVNYWLGEGYFKLEEYEKAIEYYKLVQSGEYQQYALYSIGFSLLKLKNYDEAVSCLNGITNPALLLQAEFLIASAFYEKEDYDEAISKLQQIKGKYEPEASFLLGEIFYKKSKFKEAVECYAKCHTPLGISGLAKSYYALRNYPKALEQYKKLLLHANHKADAIESIGRIYYDQKLYREAIEWLDKGTTYSAKLMAGNCCFELGKYELAFSRYDSLYQATQKSEPLYRMALSAYKLKEYEKAKELLVEAELKSRAIGTEYQAPDPKVSLLLGEIAYKEGKYDDALKYYREASSSGKECEGLIGMRACYIALKKPADAYKVAKLLVNKYPNKETYQEFAEAAYFNKKYDEAAEYYSRGEGPDALLRASNIYYENGKYAQAIQGFRDFLKSYPLHKEAAQVKYLIGLSYRKKEEFAESRTILNEFLRLYPGTTFELPARCAIGDNFYDEGNYKESEIAYRDALQGIKYDEKSLRPICGILDSKLQLEGLASALTVAKTYIERLKETGLVDELRMKAGDMCFNEAKFEPAIVYYEGVRDSKLLPLATYSIANCYKKLGKLEDAIKYFESVVSRFANSKFSPLSLYELGEMFYNKKKYEKSIDYLNKLSQNYKGWEKEEEVKLRRALCYIKLEKVEDAEKELRNILSIGKENRVLAQARLELAKLLITQEKIEDAKQELTQVLQSKVTEILPEARYELGGIYFKQKEYELALKTYLQVKYLYGENKFITPALYGAAQCAKELNNKEEAKKLYQMTIERGDDSDLTSKSKIALEKIK